MPVQARVVTQRGETMTGPDTAKPSEDREDGGHSNGGVTTVAPSTQYQPATSFSDDTPHSPYGSGNYGVGNSRPDNSSPDNSSPDNFSPDSSTPDSARSDSVGTGSRAPSSWTGSPYEPLPSDSSPGYPLSGVDSYGSAPAYADPTPTYIPAAPELGPVPPPVNGKQTKSRAIAGLISAAVGTLLVAGGLYLVGEFGFRIFDVMLNVGGRPAPWDIAWTSVGAVLIFAAVLLNGWSPWATLPAGLGLTAAGIWSIAWYDGADRVATAIDKMFARPEMVVWGINGWLLVLGLILTAASGAAVIARAAGRRRGLPSRR